MALRVDIGTLRPAKRLADGRVRVDAHISRIGIQEYMNRDGSTRRELRLPEHVFDPASLESFEQLPVTNLHPPEAVTTDNAREYMVGASGDRIVRDDDHVRAPLMVADKQTIDALDGGEVGVSCGYFCDLVEKPGTHPQFGKYDAIQTNIRGNHIAVAVPNPRAGKTARVRMDDQIAMARFAAQSAPKDSRRSVHMDDAAVMVQDVDERSTPTRGRTKMPKPDDKKNEKLTLDAAVKAVAEADSKTKAAEERADEAEGKLAGETKRADAAEGKIEAMTKEIEQLKEDRIDGAEVQKLKDQVSTLQTKLGKETSRADAAGDPKKFGEAVKKRAQIEKVAAMILGADGFNEDATDRELMISVIEHLDDVKIDEKVSDERIGGRFDSTVDRFMDSESALDKLRARARKDAESEREERTDGKSPRQEYLDKQQNGWKRKTA